MQTNQYELKTKLDPQTETDLLGNTNITDTDLCVKIPEILELVSRVNSC